MVQITDYRGVLILYNESTHLIKGEQSDLIADLDVLDCAQAVHQALESTGMTVQLGPIKGDPETVLAQYSPEDWLVFNLAEGGDGKLFEEARIAWLLEVKGYCFTGSSGRAIALTTNKALTKYYLKKSGLHTPAWWMFRSVDEIPQDQHYPFPLFAKPLAEDASLGIEDQSVISTLEQLRERVAYLTDRYQQSALVEEFISGREFNAAAWGNPAKLLPLAEIDFRDIPEREFRIVNFAAKWEQDSYEYHHTPSICPANLTPILDKMITRAALSALKCAGVNTYARVDLRLDSQEIPFILEINCNPDISPGAGFFHAVQAAGYSFPEMVLKIIQLARRPSDEYYPASSQRRWK